MKNEKRNYNLLLIRYNKYKAKYLRLLDSGENEHRIHVLQNHHDHLCVGYSCSKFVYFSQSTTHSKVGTVRLQSGDPYRPECT